MMHWKSSLHFLCSFLITLQHKGALFISPRSGRNLQFPAARFTTTTTPLALLGRIPSPVLWVQQQQFRSLWVFPLSSPLSACSEAGARTEPSERPLSGDPHGASRRFQQIRELQRALLISQTCNQYDAALFITAVKNMQEVPSGPNRYRV